jgi:hypothetical protein
VEFSNTFKQLNAINLECTLPKRLAIVIFPEVKYELSLVMENVKERAGGNPPALQK